MAACRALVAFFISPAGSLGSAVVAETFFRAERARYMGVWTLAVGLGVPVAPFIFGFAIQRVDFRWVYWSLAIAHAVELVVYFFLGRETRFLRHEDHYEASQSQRTSIEQRYFSFGRIDHTPVSLIEFIAPLRFFFHVRVFGPAVAYSMVFLFGYVMTTVEIPQLFAAKFELGPQSLGLQFLAVIVGSVIGEQIGGWMSDRWMNARTQKLGRRPAPEYRLWLSYPGIVMTIVGVAVFLLQIEHADSHWNITPDVGVAIAAAGNQLLTTVLITYAVDHYLEDAASVGVFITFVRQIWGFIGPFWFPYMFANVGLAGSAGTCAALMVGASLIPVLGLQFMRLGSVG